MHSSFESSSTTSGTPSSTIRPDLSASRRRGGRRSSRRAPSCRLLDRCLSSRCDDAWRALSERYGGRIRATLRAASLDVGLEPTAAEIDEMVQELYLCWLRRGQGFHGSTDWHFWSFVGSSARNLAVDALRRETAAKRCLEIDAYRQPVRARKVHADPDWPVLQLRMAGGWTPETRLLEEEKLRRWNERLRALLDDFSPDPAIVQALWWAVVEGRTSEEVRRLLRERGVEVEGRNVDVWVSRLRSYLRLQGLRLPRRCLEPEGVWPARWGHRTTCLRTEEGTHASIGERIER